MTEAATPVLHRVCQPGQWPQLTEQDHATIKDLGHIGIPRNAAATLVAIHRFGNDHAVTSWWLEHIIDARQPEISLAISWLMRFGAVKIERTIAAPPGSGKGRPINVYVMNVPVAEFVRMISTQYRIRAEEQAAAAIAAFGGA